MRGGEAVEANGRKRPKMQDHDTSSTLLEEGDKHGEILAGWILQYEGKHGNTSRMGMR